MAKKKAADRPIGHAPWDRGNPEAPQCTTCNERWPCKIWRRWTQTRQHQEAEAEKAKIRADIARWQPGLWAQEVAPGPACTCGLAREGGPDITCHRHPRKEET
ncbi:hypothetical protein [Streptomyces sp. NPDC046925]|uniref:hypothetical protein n=1 Tax=Streptomyces sp. NPDC046925 TaxID=3155375 RepID=UPI0033D4B7AB